MERKIAVIGVVQYFFMSLEAVLIRKLLHLLRTVSLNKESMEILFHRLKSNSTKIDYYPSNGLHAIEMYKKNAASSTAFHASFSKGFYFSTQYLSLFRVAFNFFPILFFPTK